MAGQFGLKPGKLKSSRLSGLTGSGYQLEAAYRLILPSRSDKVRAGSGYIGVGYYYRHLDIEATVVERHSFVFDEPYFSGALSPLLNTLFPPRVNSFQERAIKLTGPTVSTGGFFEIGGQWPIADQFSLSAGLRFSDRTLKTSLSEYWADRLPDYLQSGFSINILAGIQVNLWKKT